jgi:endonuclease/exonuclease/phosphatase family metal-dependent hydrolase
MKKGAVIFLGIFLVLSFAGLAKKPPQDDLWMLRLLSKNPNSVLVMTRNIYVGGDVDRVIEEPDFNQVPVRVAETFAEVMSTDFNYRVGALADEIEKARPHLVGLQEVSLVRYQSPGNFSDGYYFPDADTVLWDYLKILTTELENRGLDYDVAGIVQNADVEVPMIVSFIPPFAFDDVRLTDFDVVLARKDVVTGNVVQKNYADLIYSPPIIISRGYVALDATVGHKTYRFVNTHLEPADPAIQAAQAAELIADLESETLPIILVGDLNTPAPTGDTYQTLLFNGYVDAWTQNLVRPRIPGYTSGHDSNLRNATVDLDERIDLIMVKSRWSAYGLPIIGPVFAYVVGDELEDRLIFPPDGSLIWPSDHAGVVALLHIPIPGKGK